MKVERERAVAGVDTRGMAGRSSKSVESEAEEEGTRRDEGGDEDEDEDGDEEEDEGKDDAVAAVSVTAGVATVIQRTLDTGE